MIIKNPYLTEKATQASERGLYTFEVAKNTNKRELVKEIERMFKVKVKSITTLIIKGKKVNMRKRGRVVSAHRSDIKKATVRLQKGQKLNIYPEENK